MTVQQGKGTTAQGQFSPLWAAPEVFRHEKAGQKADIWSFGILIFELVRLWLQATITRHVMPAVACVTKTSDALLQCISRHCSIELELSVSHVHSCSEAWASQDELHSWNGACLPHGIALTRAASHSVPAAVR